MHWSPLAPPVLLTTVATTIALVAAGCGGGPTASVIVSGSSTVEPISIAVAEHFSKTHDRVSISVDGPGTGDGFELFCDGLTDINDASSKIKDEQIEACASKGIEFIELPIGNDGVVMLTNEANTAVKCLSLADIYALLGPESQGIRRWSDAQDLDGDVAGVADFPDLPLDAVGPGEESGTYVSFVELALKDIAESRDQPVETRPDYQSSSDDNIILQGVQGSDSSLGWVGYAFAREAEGVSLLEVDGGEGCVAPSAETIADGSYPLSRPLFIYVNAQAAEDNEALAAFVDDYLGAAVSSVQDVGYVALNDEALAQSRERWAQRTQGAL